MEFRLALIEINFINYLDLRFELISDTFDFFKKFVLVFVFDY